MKTVLTAKLNVCLNYIEWCGGTAPRKHEPRVGRGLTIIYV
jgi:hypothetical protein